MTEDQKGLSAVKESSRINKIKDLIKIGEKVLIERKNAEREGGLKYISIQEMGVILQKYKCFFIVQLENYRESFLYHDRNFKIIDKNKKSAWVINTEIKEEWYYEKINW